MSNKVQNILEKIKTVPKSVDRSDICVFFNNGCGNGGYCSGMDAEPPGCSLSKKSITPSCKGDLTRCEVDQKEATYRNRLIKQYEGALNHLKRKI